MPIRRLETINLALILAVLFFGWQPRVAKAAGHPQRGLLFGHAAARLSALTPADAKPSARKTSHPGLISAACAAAESDLCSPGFSGRLASHSLPEVHAAQILASFRERAPPVTGAL